MPLSTKKRKAFAAGAGFAIVVMFAGVAIWLMLDVDSDGRSGYQEIGDGTNPIDGDSDDDGIADGWDLDKHHPENGAKDGIKSEGCDLGILNCQQEQGQPQPSQQAPPSGGDGTTTTFIAGGALSLVAGVGARITSTMILRK